MNEVNKKHLNDFFVEVFNSILIKEEKIFESSQFKDLTIKECHVIEAIHLLKESGNNKMTCIANKINISVGALTTSIKTLIKKGYVERRICEQDHRIIYIELTKKGEQANLIHLEFHNKLIDCIVKSHTSEELETLKECLNTFNNFFKTM